MRADEVLRRSGAATAHRRLGCGGGRGGRGGRGEVSPAARLLALWKTVVVGSLNMRSRLSPTKWPNSEASASLPSGEAVRKEASRDQNPRRTARIFVVGHVAIAGEEREPKGVPLEALGPAVQPVRHLECDSGQLDDGTRPRSHLAHLFALAADCETPSLPR